VFLFDDMLLFAQKAAGGTLQHTHRLLLSDCVVGNVTATTLKLSAPLIAGVPEQTSMQCMCVCVCVCVCDRSEIIVCMQWSVVRVPTTMRSQPKPTAPIASRAIRCQRLRVVARRQ
jgi:hypothetical protein